MFVRIITSGESNPSRIVHNFLEKFFFKGSLDATGKLVKSHAGSTYAAHS